MNVTQGYLFEDDSGIMSEVETSSTSKFKRSSKERASHPPSNYMHAQPRTSPGELLNQKTILDSNLKEKRNVN